MRRRTLPTLGAAGLLGLLGLLAVLQYEWAGELSEAELDRLRTSAQSRALEFARQFDREVTRAYLWFSLAPGGVREGDWSGLLRANERWEAHAPYPRIVEGVYALRAGGGGSVPLVLEPSEGRVAEAPWPVALASLLGRLRAELAASRTAGHERFGLAADRVEDELPALVIPVLDVEAVPEGPAARRTGEFPLLGFTVVLLDRRYLHEGFLPALERRYLDQPGGLGCELQVFTARELGKPFYASSDLGPHPPTPDASVRILDVRFDPQNRDLAEGMDPALEQLRRHRFGFEGRGPGAGRHPSASASAGPRHPEGAGHWRAALWTRGGGLAAVVGAARRRNLAMSFVVLILMGASVALLVSAARRAERLARQKVEFVAGVTHELRTPLAVIRSAGENLADGLVGDEAQVRSYGALVRDEGRRLTEMVEQVLELAGAESRRGPARPRPLPVDRLIDQALASCEADLRAADVTVERDVPAGLPPVLGDEAALRRALRNLIDNAIKYGGQARWIRVRARGDCGRHGPEVRLTVEDRGPGIAAEDMPHIFEPFYRGRAGQSRQVHGSGLGLSLVRRIAENHGGHVAVESGPEQGSVFTLTLPGPTPARHSSPSPEDANAEAHPAR